MWKPSLRVEGDQRVSGEKRRKDWDAKKRTAVPPLSPLRSAVLLYQAPSSVVLQAAVRLHQLPLFATKERKEGRKNRKWRRTHPLVFPSRYQRLDVVYMPPRDSEEVYSRAGRAVSEDDEFGSLQTRRVGDSRKRGRKVNTEVVEGGRGRAKCSKKGRGVSARFTQRKTGKR